MTHPGMAFVLVVGVGLATILYYMFADNNSHNSHNTHGGDGSMPSDTPNNSWTPHDRPRCRRKESNAGGEKASCTICLNDIGVQQIAYVHPCRHPFHASCIQEWRDQGQMESHNLCPNCRKKIESVR